MLAITLVYKRMKETLSELITAQFKENKFPKFDKNVIQVPST